MKLINSWENESISLEVNQFQKLCYIIKENDDWRSGWKQEPNTSSMIELATTTARFERKKMNQISTTRFERKKMNQISEKSINFKSFSTLLKKMMTWQVGWKQAPKTSSIRELATATTTTSVRRFEINQLRRKWISFLKS